MSGLGVKQSPAAPEPEILESAIVASREFQNARERQAERFRLLWDRRRFFLRAGAVGLLASTLVAFLIPSSYTATSQLMPPDQQSTSGMAMMAAMISKEGSNLGGVAGDLLGLKSSGALFIGVLKSQTSQDRLVGQFDLRKVYGKRRVTDARMRLNQNTSISEDRKSGIITINVTDRTPQRAAAIANAYVNQLNFLVAELSTSSAHRERVFLEERLKVAKQDLDDATNQLAQFSSKNTTLDVEQEGKAMLDAAGTIAGELIAAQSQLEGLRQIYTDNNPRVRALSARVGELRKQLEKFGGAQRNLPNTNPQSGQSADPSSNANASTSMPFPTIRNFPLLGAKYTDYFRRAKIQETVFELLTQQYELAKVEEAKETPSVKILDPATVPEKKSFPPRLVLMILGTCLILGCSVAWVLGTKNWEQADPNDPRKILAQEVFATMKAHAPWASPNGDGSSTNGQRVWSQRVWESGEKIWSRSRARIWSRRQPPVD